MGKSFNTGTLVNGVTVLSDGNVGIGTTSPSTYTIAPQFVLDTGTSGGGMTIKTGTTSSTTNYGGLFFADGTTGTEQYRGFIQYSHNFNSLTDTLIFGTAGAERMYINATGNVGIGTSTPNDLLEVRGGFIRLSATAGNGPQLNIYSNGQTSGNVTLAQGFALATDNIGYLYNRANAAFVFGTNNSEKMRILANGNVGIGTTSPSSLLEVRGTTPFIKITDTAVNSETGLIMDAGGGTIRGGLTINYGTGEFKSYCGVSGNSYFQTFYTNGSERIRITSTGTVVAGATGNTPTGTDNSAYLWVASQNRMYINAVGGGCATFGRASTTGNIMGFDYNGGGVGNISTNGSTITFSGTAVSDARYKEDIEPITDALDTINQVDFVTFKYKESGHDSAGVTSQQIQTIEKLSLFVIDGIDEESYKAFDYNALVGYLGKAIQELKAEIDILKNK